MFDKLVAGLLTSYLGEYFENIDTEQVKVSVWAGHVNLNRLTVRKDALRFFDVPFCIEKGFIEELVVVIPWTRLQSESVVFKMKGVRVVVQRKTYDNYPLAQRRNDADVRRQRELEANEEVLLDEHFREARHRAAKAHATGAPAEPTLTSQSDEDRKNSTFSARLKASILNNIKVEMQDLELQYEATSGVAASSPSQAPGAGVVFRLASLEAFPCNSAYQKTFITAIEGGKGRMLHKMVLIKGVQVALMEGLQSPPRALTAPLSAALRVQYQPVPLVRNAPTCLMGAQLGELSATLCQEDVQLLYTVAQDLFAAAEYDDWERLKQRPLQRVHRNARAWFHYAVQSVILVLRKKRQRGGFSWEAYKKLKEQRDTYARLYRRSRRTTLGADKWLTPLTAREEVDFLNLEETLPVETIKLGRRLALARVSVERQEYLTLKQSQAQQRHATAAPTAETGRTPQAGNGASADAKGPSPDDGAGSGSGWLKRWWSGAPNPAVERAIEKETSPEVRAVMQETVELMSTTKWTEAQRLAIAREFGFSAQEADAMAEASGSPTSVSGAKGATDAARADGDDTGAPDPRNARCSFKGMLYFTSANVRLARRRAATTNAAGVVSAVKVASGDSHVGAAAAAVDVFADVHLQGIILGTTAWENGRMESVFCVHDLGIRGAAHPLIYMCTDDSASATPRAVPSAAQQHEQGKRMVAQVLQDREASLVALAQAQTSALGYPGLFVWGTREDLSSLKRESAPHHIHVDIQPVAVNMDVKFLYETVQFFLAAYNHMHGDQQDIVCGESPTHQRTATPWRVSSADLASVLQDGGSDLVDASHGATHRDTHESDVTDSDANRAEDAYIRSVMGIAPVTLLPVEVRDLADRKSCLASLARKVEAAWIVDWSVSVGSVTLLVMEVEGEQGSRIHSRGIQVQYDVQRQLKRAARLAAIMGAVESARSTADAGAFPVVSTDTAFGDDEDDWLNVINTTIGEFSLSCLLPTGPQSSSDAAQWQHVVEPVAGEVEIKRNVMSRRNARHPGLSLTVSGEAPLHLTLSRSRLSVLCTSLSFLIDFVQRTIREIMMTRTPTASIGSDTAARVGASTIRRPSVLHAAAAASSGELGWDEKRLFRARVMNAEKRFWRANVNGMAEQDNSEGHAADDGPFTTADYLQPFNPAPLQTLEYRYLHVQRGALVVFHAMRPTYPHFCIELVKGHYHVSHTEEDPSDGEDSGAVRVHLYVEQGGINQETGCCLDEARRAQSHLTSLFPIPSAAFQNTTLLRPFVTDCLVNRRVQPNTVPVPADAAKVESALQALEAASHALPCQYFSFRFDHAADAIDLMASLQCAGLTRGLYTATLQDYTALRDSVPEAIREQRVVVVAFTFPACVIDLAEEGPPQSDASQRRGLSQAQLTFAPFVASAAHGLQWDRYELDTDDIHLQAVDADGHVHGKTSLLAVHAVEQSTADAPPIHMDCTLHAVPGNGLHPTRKVTTMRVAPGHVLDLHLRSECVQVVELLWDLVGIATNRVFSATVIPAVPWWEADDGSSDASIQAVEDTWVAAASCPERQQQHVIADFAAVGCAIYLPSDSQAEWAPCLTRQLGTTAPSGEDAVSVSALPLLQVHAANVRLDWCLDAAANRARGTFDAPVVKSRVLELIPTASDKDHAGCEEGGDVVDGFMLGTSLQTLCAPESDKDVHPSCTVDFAISSVIPILSLSDFLRNRSKATAASSSGVDGSADAPAGFRFTKSFVLTAHGLRTLYFQPQLMALLDIGTRGVMERAMAITNRPAYLFGSSSRALASAVLPPWPAQWAAMPPADVCWTLMSKKVSLDACTVLVPRSPEAAASITDMTDSVPRGAVFVLEVPTLEMVDRLETTWVHEAAVALSNTSASSVLSSVRVITRVRFVNTAVKSATSAFDGTRVDTQAVLTREALSVVCPSLSLQVRLSVPLFDAAKYTQGKHRDCTMRFAPMIWRANASDLAYLVQTLFHQYMDRPALSPFAPRPFPSVDPYVSASLAVTGATVLKETSRTTVTLPQCCVHVFDACTCIGVAETAARSQRPRDPISSAVAVKAVSFSMDSKLNDHFDCSLSMDEASVWDLAPLGARGAEFKADPSELCDEARGFVRLLPVPKKARAAVPAPSSQTSDESASQALHVWYTSEPGVTTFDAVFGVVQLSLVPHFFFDARDGFGALAMRDAIGRVLRWPPHPLTALSSTLTPSVVSPPPQASAHRRWHASIGQLRLSLPDVLHNTLNPFLLFSVAGIDVLDEMDATGHLKERHVIIKELTRNGMYIYPDEFGAGDDSPTQQPSSAAAAAVPKLRVLFIPPVPIADLRVHQDPPSHATTTARRGLSSSHAGCAADSGVAVDAVTSPNTDLMDALFGDPFMSRTTASSVPPPTSPPSLPSAPSAAPASASVSAPPQPLFSCVQTPSDEGGLVVRMSPVWLVVPHRHHVECLSSLWSQGGLSTLASLGTFLEERAHTAVTATTPIRNGGQQKKTSSLFPRIQVTVEAPALVLPDRGTNPGSATELQRGMLLSVGTLLFEKRKEVAPSSLTRDTSDAQQSAGPSASAAQYQRVWRLRVPDVALYAISRPDEALLQPFTIALERWDDAPIAWGWRLHVEKVSLQMEQRYYEMLLQTVVRNMLTAAAATGSCALGAESEPSSRTLDFGRALRWFSTGAHTGHHAGTAAPTTTNTASTADAVPSPSLVDRPGGFYSMAEDELGLRHPFPAYEAPEEDCQQSGTAALSASDENVSHQTMRVFQIHLKMDGVELCVFDNDTAAYLCVEGVDVVSNAEWRLLPASHTHDASAGPLPFRAAQWFLLQGQPRLVDRRRQVTARIGRVEVGLRQSAPLLSLVSSPVQHTIEDPTVIDVSAAAYFALDQKNLEETVEGHLGDGTLRLDSSVVSMAIEFLYRPYARIVLPRYEVGDVMVLTRDRLLTESLYLSQRATLRVSGEVLNSIVLNAGGNEIHFMNENAQGSAGAVVFVDEGVTLRIVNAILCFHGNSLDYYVKAGNGGYVVVDRQSCTTVSADEAAVTVADVRQALVAATADAGNDVMDTLFSNFTVTSPTEPTTTTALTRTTDHVGASPADTRRRRLMRRYIIASSLRTEVPEPLYAHRTTSAEAPNRTLSRVLVLTATIHCCVVDIQQGDGGGDAQSGLRESDSCTGTFDLTHFAVHSETRLQDRSAAGGLADGATRAPAVTTRTERADLVSEWAVQVLYTKSADGRSGSDAKVSCAYDIVAKRGLDVHIRYRDLFVCTAAMQQANQALRMALGDVQTGAFSDIMTSLNAKSDQSRDVLRARANAARVNATAANVNSTTTAVTVALAYCDIFLVNDQSSVDLPLFHVRVDQIRTPTSTLTVSQRQWTLQLTLAVEFYDLSASSWYPCLEAVAVEVKVCQVVNLSVDELMARKGFHEVNMIVKPAKMYISPLLLGAVRRAMDVREAFQKEQAQLELYGPARAGGGAAASGRGTDAHASPQFHSVSVRQELGVKAVHLDFPSALSATRRLEGQDIEPRAEYAFDYPRVAGKEAPRTEQYILVSVPPHDLVQRVYTCADGVAQVPLGHDRLARHPIVEVSVTQGRKLVLLRTNVSFVNNLSFQLLLEGGVGCVQARGGARLHVPVEQLRQRMRFLPNVAFKCDDCGLGIRYENLPALRGRTFLCLCPVEVNSDGAHGGRGATNTPQVLLRTDDYELRRSMQRHLYFLLRVRDAAHATAAAMDDVVGHFDAPLYVVNHTGLPLQLHLMTQRTVQGRKVGILDMGSDRYQYDWVATVTVPPALDASEKASRQDITQVDPFQDMAVDAVVRLPNGAVLGQRLESRVSMTAPRPACVYAPDNPSRRDERMTLMDPKTGSTLVLTVSYEGNDVHIFCPYWLVNDTSHPLQLTDVNPEKESHIPLIAGLQLGTPCDIIPPMGSQRLPYLYCSERAVKLKEKAHVYARVGVSGQGVLSWTRWSSLMNLFEPVESAALTCMAGNGVVMTLSYSVAVGEGRLSDTRIITVRPRWVLVNRTPRGLSLRFASVGTPSSGTAGVAALSTETTVASTACHVFNRAPAAAAAAAAMTSGGSGANMANTHNSSGGAYLQLKFSPDPHSGEVEACQWSSPFCISEEGEHAYNVRYRGLVRLEDYWPISQGGHQGSASVSSPSGSFASATAVARQMPASLPPIRPEDVVERERELYLRREDTAVVSVACVRRDSTLFVVVTDATNPPFVIENRTDYMVWLRQDRLDTSVAVYPKRTKAYTWESETLPLQMVLWVTDGTMTHRSAEVRIGFEPRALLQGGDASFRQEVEMPTALGDMPCTLFVRVRGVHGASYAVSITTEPTIDAYRVLPYRQFFYRLHLDALYALMEDDQHEDVMLLTVRPIRLELAQAAHPRAGRRISGPTTGAGTGVSNASLTAPNTDFAGDVQRVDVNLKTVQLDDERPHAKQKVVAQLVDDHATYCKYERYMLRSTPILYVPKCAVYACPLEFHVEDSYLYDVMQYGESMRLAWEGSTRTHLAEGAASSAVAGHGWMEVVATLGEQNPLAVTVASKGTAGTTKQASNRSSASSGSAAVARATPSWTRRVIFFSRLFIEKLLVSISLYRSPGAQNDPIWQRVGALSLLLRSVKDARLEWSRIDQRQVTEVVWVLLTKYSAFYRRRFQDQIPNLINIAGIANVKGFFNKLVEDPGDDKETTRRQKPRVGRRSEANFIKDSPAHSASLRHRSELIVKVETFPPGVSGPPQPYSAARLNERLRQRMRELSGPRAERSLLDLPFTQMLRLLTTREDLLLFGNAAIRMAIAASAPTYDITTDGTNAHNTGTLRSAEQVVAMHYRHTSTAASPASSRACRRCGEVEALEQQYAAANMPNPLPHPDEGVITWPEFVHHINWDAFVKMCTVDEVQQYGGLVKDGIVGCTNNVVRLTTQR